MSGDQRFTAEEAVRVVRSLSRESWPCRISMEMTGGEAPLFACWLEDFGGCIAQGVSVNEARANLARMLPLFWEGLCRIGALNPADGLPLPAAPPTLTFDGISIQGFGGERSTAEWRAAPLRSDDYDPAPEATR